LVSFSQTWPPCWAIDRRKVSTAPARSTRDHRSPHISPPGAGRQGKPDRHAPVAIGRHASFKIFVASAADGGPGSGLGARGGSA